MLACGTGFGESCSPSFSLSPHPPYLSLHACPLAQLQFGSLHKAFGGSLPPHASFTHQNKESFLFGNQEFGLTHYFSWVLSCQPNWTCSSCLCAFSSLLRPFSPAKLWVPLKRGSFQLTAVLCAHTDLLLAWALVSLNSFKAGTAILISIPWGVHRNKYSRCL